jgi:hypothetical protein
MGRLLIFLSGAQPDILRFTRADRAKYEGVGFAIFFTGVLASISMAFALHTALGAPLALAAATGAGWGFLIMGIDRMLVVSIYRGRGWRNFFLVILPRLLLGLLISVIISTPFVLEIFRPEIEQQIGVIHQQQLAAYARAQQDNALGQEIATLQKDIASLTQQLRQPSGVASLTAQYAAAQSAAQGAYAQWQCQLSGGPGCVAGNGPLAKTAQNAYQKDEAKANALNQELNLLEGKGAGQDLQQRISQDHAKLDADITEQNEAAAKAIAAILSDNGLLIRLQALGQVTADDFTLQAARLLLFLLFTVIECMPVLSKVLLYAGSETAYERALKYDVEKQVEVARKMSDDKLKDADSLLAERDRIRAESIIEPAARAPGRLRAPRPFGLTPRLRGRLGRPRRVPRLPGAPRPPRRAGRRAFWRRRRPVAATWPSWAAFPPGGAGQSVNGSALPPVFLSEPVPGTPADGGAAQNGTP